MMDRRSTSARLRTIAHLRYLPLCWGLWPLAAVGQPLPTPTELSSRLRESIDLRAPFRQTVRLVIFKDEVPGADPAAIKERLVRLDGLREHENREVSIHPRFGCLLEFSHPRMREEFGPANVSLKTRAYTHVKFQVDAHARRGPAPKEDPSHALPNYTYIGDVATIASGLQNDSLSEVHRDDGGRLIVNIPSLHAEFTLDAIDLRLLSSREEDDVPHRMSRSYIAHSPNHFTTAAWPLYKLVSVDQPDGTTFNYVMIFENPRAAPDLDQSDFEWSTYAAKAVDPQTGEVFGPGDVPLPKADRAPQAKRNGAPVAEIDLKKAHRASLDPGNPVLPKTRQGWSTWLTALGAAALALAGAWYVRRRMA